MKNLTRAALTIAAAAVLALGMSVFVIAQESKAPAAGAPAAGAPGAKGKPAITPEQQKNIINMVNEKLKHRFTPVIKSFDIGPAKVGKPVKVTISAAYEDKRAIDKITEASVFYSINDGKNFIGPVKLAPAGAGKWSGNIPAIKKAGTVIAYPRVKDSFGNVAVHLPCNVGTWPPFGDGCMVSGAADPEPVDDPAAKVENNFDIWDLRVGLDGKYLYIDQNVEGDIDKGTMNPPHINAYIAMVVDSKTLNDFDDAGVLMQPDAKDKFKDKANMAFTIMYAPLAKAAAGSDAKMQIPSCAVPREVDGKMQLDGKSVTCKPDGSDLYFRLDRSILPPSMKDSFIVLGSLSGFINNLQAPVPNIREVTAFTRVSMKPYSFNVK